MTAASEGLRFGCDVKALATALGDALRGTAKRPSIEVLRGVHMQADTAGVTLTACDLQTTVAATLAADVATPGAVVVADPRGMLALVKTLAGPVTVEADGDARTVAVVAAGGSRFTFETLEAFDFPKAPELGGASGVINTAALLGVLAHVLPVVSRDESRSVLSGALVSIEGATLRVVGTDSYRLAMDSAAGSCSLDDLDATIIPGSALAEVVRFAKRKGAPAGVAWQASQEREGRLFVRFTVGAVTVTTRRIEGQYPNWAQLIPDTFELEATLPGAEFAAACKRVAAVIPKSSAKSAHYSPLRLEFGQDGATAVSWFGQDGGGASETLTTPSVLDWTTMADGTTPAPIAPIGLNAAFLADAVAFCGETARVRILSPLRPLLFLNGRERGEAFHLLMPVRLAG